ncbi:MAG: hypothetical protein L6V95_04830 [Candidatus Melainabacteria bacterium]|nr:MAG: hypothetical protein L6V95_04830 [Candidatus Melainabacteria bacterium]
MTTKFNADVATLQEQLQAGSITQEQYNEQYLELQNALSEAKMQLEEQASNVIDFDEISKEGQRISQELNKATTEKKCGKNFKVIIKIHPNKQLNLNGLIRKKGGSNLKVRAALLLLYIFISYAFFSFIKDVMNEANINIKAPINKAYSQW